MSLLLLPRSAAAIVPLLVASVSPVNEPAHPPATYPEEAYLLTASGDYFDTVLTGTVGGVWEGQSTLDALPAGTHDIALVLGPTGIAQPSDTYLQAAYNLYLHPSGAYTGSEADVYSFYTPENSGNTEVGLNADVAELKALEPMLANDPELHVTLFGYSQSTAAINQWLNSTDGAYADQINFVMVGDSGSPHGMLANMYESLPPWLQQIVMENLNAWGLGGAVLGLPGVDPVTVLAPDSPYSGDVFTAMSAGPGSPYPDGYAYWPADSFSPGGNWFNQLLGLFGTHVTYMGMTPDDVAAAMAGGGDHIGGVDYFDLNPDQSMLELFTQAAAASGWLPESWAEALVSIGL